MLTWVKVDNYALRSECGTWTICKIILIGQVRFELRRSVPRAGRNASVWEKARSISGDNHGSFLTTREAKDRAEQLTEEVEA
jgi:hypothetical protein